MDESHFNRLVKKDEYQVFLLSSPLPWPLSFIYHLWFVINKKGKLFRWEVGHWGEKKKGYIFLNFMKPDLGFVKSPIGYLKDPRTANNKRYNAKVIAVFESKKAIKLIKIIEKNNKNYPFILKYHFIGPNSNTYIQWIISKFHGLDIKLPRNAIGKDYSMK